MTLEEALTLIKQLSTVDKVRLIERLAPEIERELMTANAIPRKSLWGLCADLGQAPSADEIDRARATDSRPTRSHHCSNSTSPGFATD